MGAMPFGSISVCKLEADEEEEGVEGGQERKRGNPPLPLPLIGRPARVRGHRGRLSSSWHPPGVCTSIAPGAALTINILNFFKMQKPHQQTLDHRVFQGGNFWHFFRVVCRSRMEVASMAGGKLGRSGGRGGAAQARLLCLAPACIGAGTTPPACPQHCLF